MNSDPLNSGAWEEELMKATNEAIAEKEKLLQGISETDEFNPIGLIPSGPPSQFRNVAWNAINNVDPTSPNATADLDKFIREAGCINQYGMKNFRFGLQRFFVCCDSVKFRREMWLSALRFRKK